MWKHSNRLGCLGAALFSRFGNALKLYYQLWDTDVRTVVPIRIPLWHSRVIINLHVLFVITRTLCQLASKQGINVPLHRNFPFR